MNTRERFLKILDFEPVDRTLNWEFGYWGGALLRWYREGLPRKHGVPKDLIDGEGVAGPGLHWPILSLFDDFTRDRDVAEHFGFDEPLDLVPFNCWVQPKFEKVIIREDEEHRELIDENGVRKWEYKDGRSMPQFLSFPVRGRADWERMKEERFQPAFADRLRGELAELKRKFGSRTNPLGILGEPGGFYGSVRLLMGEEPLLYCFYDDPQLVKRIMNFLCDFWIDCCLELLEHFEVDAVYFWEDMAGKNGPSISPAMFREFMLPPYRRIIGALRRRGVKHFIVDNDGNLDVLLPLFLECGFTGIYPIEKQAGNDLLKLRQRYPRLQIMGGFDKNTLFRDFRAIDRELQDFAAMIRQGGFVPFADHTIPSNSGWENFRYYRQRLGEIISTTPCRPRP